MPKPATVYTESQETAARKLKRVGCTVEEIANATGLPNWLAYRLTKNVTADRDGIRALERWVSNTILMLKPG